MSQYASTAWTDLRVDGKGTKQYAESKAVYIGMSNWLKKTKK